MTGTNKKLNFGITKTIKINKKQLKNWNPKKIREFLDNEAIYNIKEVSIKEEISNIYQPLYQVKKGTNIIKILDKIYEDLVNYMNILKLDTYPEEIRNHCIYIMKESNGFLQNQLKSEKDKNVIVIQAEKIS